MKKLADKIAVVTGGNSGIGLATAKLFALEGARVAIIGRDPLGIRNAVKEIGHDSAGLVSDVSNVDCITDAFQNITSKFDAKIDILVINAGVYVTAPLSQYTEEMFDQTSDINFKGAFFSVQRALPYLNDGAAIILTGSTVAEKAKVNGSAFAATKAAIRSLARSFSAELAYRNIRVNVISPGPTDTPVFQKSGATPDQVEGAKSTLIKLTPIHRMAEAREIAKAFLYVASEDSRYMLGAELIIDGGFRSV